MNSITWKGRTYVAKDQVADLTRELVGEILERAAAQRYYDEHKNDGTAMDRAKLAEKLGASPAPQTRCRIF
jgi:hypothetical protein